MKFAHVLIVLALALLLGPLAGALQADPGPDPGCGCIACECPDCPRAPLPCQMIDHLPHPHGADPAIWHPDILNTARDLDVAAKKFGQTCDKITSLADGALGHAYSAGAWTAGPIALALGVLLGCVLGSMARGRPPRA